MRRLLVGIVTGCLLPGLIAPALAFGHLADRVPKGVTRVSVTLTFPLRTGPGSHKPAHRTLTGAATVAEVVRATDALPVGRRIGVCPMIMVMGPELTVMYLNSGGKALAEAQVHVATGSRGSSGSSACFPIRFTSGGRYAALVGNSFVRMMGRLIGVQIS